MNGWSAPHGRRATRLAAALLAILALACKGSPPPAGPDLASSLAAIVATCAVAVGDVEVRRAGKQEWSPITTGAVLRVGDTVRTLAGGFARVEFLSGNGIELEESTTAIVDVAQGAVAAGAPAPERVSVEGGVARGFFSDKPGVEIGPITIRTLDGREATLSPDAPGARFRLTATAAGTEIAVTAGAARVKSGAGEVALAAGSAVDIARDGVGPAVELIDFPESLQPTVDARFQLQAGLTIPFTWSRVEGAIGYRIQVARDLSFRELVLARDAADAVATFTPTLPGMYAWRVAARDAAGRQGEYGFARRIYCDERPRRDLLVSPADDARTRAEGTGATVRFAWQPEDGARGYRLVVASGPDLTEREVRSTTTATTAAQVTGLAPGVYYWGVYVDDERRDPLFVRARRLVVEKPAAVKVKVPRAIREWGR